MSIQKNIMITPKIKMITQKNKTLKNKKKVKTKNSSKYKTKKGGMPPPAKKPNTFITPSRLPEPTVQITISEDDTEVQEIEEFNEATINIDIEQEKLKATPLKKPNGTRKTLLDKLEEKKAERESNRKFIGVKYIEKPNNQYEPNPEGEKAMVESLNEYKRVNGIEDKLMPFVLIEGDCVKWSEYHRNNYFSISATSGSSPFTVDGENVAYEFGESIFNLEENEETGQYKITLTEKLPRDDSSEDYANYLYFILIGGHIVKIGGTARHISKRIADYTRKSKKSTNGRIHNYLRFYLKNGVKCELKYVKIKTPKKIVNMFGVTYDVRSQYYQVYEGIIFQDFYRNYLTFPILGKNASPYYKNFKSLPATAISKLTADLGFSVIKQPRSSDELKSRRFGGPIGFSLA